MTNTSPETASEKEINSGAEGIVFDIKQFALYDGPGIRDTVFMKGCPLRCQWCHNPEGLSMKPQLIVSTAACTHCGACEKACLLKGKGECTACGVCIPYCEKGLRRIAGERYAPERLAQRLLRDDELLRKAEGGITFSGGEPLLQWNFVEKTISLLHGQHIAIETSGYSSDEVFQSMMKTMDLVMMDVKIMDDALHRHYTGVSNACILRHARMLKAGDTPFIIRIPLIPGVNDNEENFTALAELLKGHSLLQRVELLPYHKTAGAKYAMVEKKYQVDFDPDKPVQITLEPFVKRSIPVRIF